jgi:hypothetical protein
MSTVEPLVEGGEVKAEELMEEVRAASESQREFLRELAKNDLFIFAKGILGYPDINKDTHGSFCRFIQSKEKLRKLGLMPRAHLKTTIGPTANAIRVVLQDPDGARVLIPAESSSLSEKILSEIRGHWEKKNLLTELFSELVPPRFSGPGVKWNSNLASINRSVNYKDHNWEAIGVGGAVVGGHYNYIFPDDIIGFEASRSQAKMSETIAWLGNIESLLINQHIDEIHWYGTRWGRSDAYAYLMRVYGDSLAVFVREAIEDGKIIFPQKHTWEEYHRLQQHSPLVWYAQYCNRPIAAGKNDLPIEQVGVYWFSNDGQRVIFDTPSGIRKAWLVEQLDRVMCCDPNSGSLTAPDTAAVSVVGTSPDDEVFTLDSWSSRVTPSGFVDEIFRKWKRWRPRALGIEKAGQQNTQHYFEKKMEAEGIYINVVPLKPRSRDKIYRIQSSMEPIVRSGRLYCLITQKVLRGQIEAFPDEDDNGLIDELDSLAYFPEMARRPFRFEELEESSKIIDLLSRRRNHITGY